MSTILTTIGDLEKELGLLDNIVQNVLVYETTDNKLVVNFRFENSKDYDNTLIAGLTATINEFAGQPPKGSIRTIVLKKLKLLFIRENEFLIVFAANPEYPDSQFLDAVHSFATSFLTCLETEEEFSVTDNAIIASQIIHTMLQDEVEFTFLPSEESTLETEEISKLADQRAAELVGIKDFSPVLDDSDAIADDKTLTQQTGLEKLLDKFTETFPDIMQSTYIQYTDEGELNKTSSGRLES
ncbi:MAG: hypothetical protein ACXAD7_09395, partial [Candidatus Kariarchaeaceae archaeon]